MSLVRKTRREAGGRVGVALDSDGFALVHLLDAEPRPVLEACEYVHFEGPDELALALSGRVREHGLQGLPATAVLPPDAYVIRPIDAPDVPDDELREATRWALRDQIDFDPTEAVVDCIPIPAELRDATRSVFGVAARGTRVDQLVEVLRESGLEPTAVEIRETTLLHLAPLVGDPAEGQAFLRLSPKRSRFGVVRGGELCMTRDLVTDLSVLETGTDEIGPELENVLLEVQRSLDYFESNFGRVPAQSLWVLPSPFELAAFVQYLAGNTQQSVGQLDLATCVETTLPLPQGLQDQVLAAFSAALRPADARTLEVWNPQLEAPAPPFSGDTLLKASGVFVAGLLAVALVGSWQNGRTAATVAEIEARIQAEAARVERMEVRAERGPDAGLAREIALLRAERTRKSRLIAALSGGELGNRAGFSGALEALARHRRDDVWLERIALAAGGHSLALSGGALRPQAVPEWLAALQGEPAFVGKSFRAFELGAPEEGAASVRFSLASERAEEGAP